MFGNHLDGDSNGINGNRGADYTGTGNASGEPVLKGYIRFYNGHFIWPYDRNLSVFVNRCNSICHYEQPGMGTDWQQLFKRIVRTGIPGFFIMVCVGIYSVLVANIQVSDNVHTALLSVMAYTVILCFSLMKTANFSKSIFNAH